MRSALRTGVYALAFFATTAASAQGTGSCVHGEAERDLEVSDVTARLLNTGALFYEDNITNATGYIVPRSAWVYPLYIAGLWVGGRVSGEVRTAAARYSDWEFWPGPLNAGATLPPGDCRRTNANDREAWDRIYVVSVQDIENYEQMGTLMPDLQDWPVGLGAPTVDANGDAVVPTSRDQLIDLEAGERPVLYGSQTAFWVMNDVGNRHNSTTSSPLGIEVQASAFAIADGSEPALYQSTFYRFRVINRRSVPIEDAHLTFFADPDLGNLGDDYVGSDPARGLAFGYNGDNGDLQYGTPPPAIGFDLLSGAGSVMYFRNEDLTLPTSDPSLPGYFWSPEVEYYHVMQGLWKDGTALTEGGDGYGSGGPPVTYAFPGDPEAGAYWSEVNADASGAPNPPGDRRVVVSTAPLTLQPGEVETMDVAVLFGIGVDHVSPVTALKAASDFVQARYDDGSLFETVPADLPEPPAEEPALLAPADGTVFTEGDVTLAWTAVPGADYYVLERSENASFADATQSFASAAVSFSPDALPPNQTGPFYWRVRAGNAGGWGPTSTGWSFTYQVYVGAPLLLSDDSPAFVEHVGPDGFDPCGATAVSTFGCEEVGGNFIYPSFNGTAEYLMHFLGVEGPEASLGAFAPNEFEVRWTEGGSYGAYIYIQTLPAQNTVIHVPFEVWDIGLTRPGEANDPSDDVRMIPALFADGMDNDGDGVPDPGTQGVCAFDLDETYHAELGFPASDRIYAFYPLEGSSYADWEAFAAPLVAGAPDECPVIGSDYLEAQAVYGEYADLPRGRPLQRVVFLDNTGFGTGDPAFLQGSVQRFYTTDPPATSTEEGQGVVEGYRLAPPYPNPFRSRASVAFEVARPEPVRLVVYDLLGREVAVLREGPVSAGRHEAVLEGRGLASGVYVVVLEARGVIQSRQKVLLLR